MKVSELKKWGKDAKKNPDYLGFTQDFVENCHKPFARYAKNIAKTPEDNTPIKDAYTNLDALHTEFQTGLAKTTVRNYLRLMHEAVTSIEAVKSLFTREEYDKIILAIEPLIKEADAQANEESKQKKAADDNVSVASGEDAAKPKKNNKVADLEAANQALNTQISALQQQVADRDLQIKNEAKVDTELRLAEALKTIASLQATIDDLRDRLMAAQTFVGKAETLQMQVDKLWQLVLAKPACT